MIQFHVIKSVIVISRPFCGIIFPMLLLCLWDPQRKRQFSENKETQYLTSVLNIRLVQQHNTNEEIFEKVDDPDTTRNPY